MEKNIRIHVEFITDLVSKLDTYLNDKYLTINDIEDIYMLVIQRR